MILELAVLNVRRGQGSAFERAFGRAQSIISSMPGYVSHTLQRCVETPDKYVLLVQWQNLEDHTGGFRQSREYQEWKRVLHHFYDPFPTVEHYEPVFGCTPTTPVRSEPDGRDKAEPRAGGAPPRGRRT